MTLTTHEITTMCQRAFGSDRDIESMQELGGGTFNTTYLITFTDKFNVILRVAPPQMADTPWDEAFLMRREHAVQPFFAPVAALMPKTLFIDFTHQLIDRDYMFQTFIEGERWDNVVDELTPRENGLLWEQFGNILKIIHNVHGESFGLPQAGFQFARWSETVNDRIKRTLQYAKDKQIDIPYLPAILEIIRAHNGRLDEIQIPRLLHGDLWLFNLLITHGNHHPAIVGVLDADRAWWGDPMADWTVFIFAHAEEREGHSHFWQAYGQPEDTPSARFRKIVYDGMYAGRAFVWAVEHQDQETVTRAEGTLREVAESLPTVI
jgi:aminoglycoside phosphotransferase (APT) family kinase protein